jgi:purine-binding chemotaxis protein CheW
MEGKYLVFSLAEEDYGLSIRDITEIIGVQRITDLPDTPHYVKGVINLRGKVIPVIDVRIRFGIEPEEYTERTCIIVVNIRGNAVGLIVDSVAEVIDIPASQVEEPPKLNRGTGSRFINGLGKVGESVKILLDTQKLLYEEELEQLVEAAA